jgi:hypothetical protein
MLICNILQITRSVAAFLIVTHYYHPILFP